MDAKEVLKIILDIANSIKYSPTLNERYLHHYFSHIMQVKYRSLNLEGSMLDIHLHPEWPTFKKTAVISYGRYKNKEGQYRLDDEGTAGFIDFAIGEYSTPEIGIEFSLKYGWSNEEIVYDFVKLLDKKNPFKTVISFNIIFRKNGLVRGGYLKDLEGHMNKAFKEARDRLDERFDASRETYLIIVEIDNNNHRQFWSYDKESGEFKKGMPIV
jgi:hypothetical protein